MIGIGSMHLCIFKLRFQKIGVKKRTISTESKFTLLTIDIFKGHARIRACPLKLV